MKNQVKFKVGDFVYYPEVSHKILKIDTIEYDCIYFKVGEFGLKILTNDDSLIWGNWIFQATQENYELLSKRYPNVTFEPPPKPKEPKEIIQAMLESGWQCVPCYTGENRAVLNSNHKKELITGLTNDLFNSWAGFNKFAIPFDPKTGKTIIDFVNGEVVLESKDEHCTN